EALRFAGGLEFAGVKAAAKRTRGRGRDQELAVPLGDPRRRTVGQHPVPVRLDPLPEAPEDRLERPARVDEQLLSRLLAAGLAPGAQLRPKPRHRDLVGLVAELPA